MKENQNKGCKALIAIGLTLASMAATSCNCNTSSEVDRVVELHYVNGEVEIKKLHGRTYWTPEIGSSYGCPLYYDGCNTIYGVVRFRVLRVDTLAQKGGSR